MADELHIRPARVEDLDAMVALTGQVFAPASIDCTIEQRLGQAGALSWLDLKAEGLRKQLAAGPEHSFVAENAGRMAGYVTNTIHRGALRGTVANLAVAADQQGQGVGRKLLEASLEHFRAIGLRQAKIETLATNAAGQHLYPAVGFVEVARQVHYVMEL